MSRQSKAESRGDTQTATKQDVTYPSLYRVLLHNDDYTPMDFVVVILKDVFRKDGSEAVRIMLNVHKRGVGVAGIYPYQIAETKVAKVHRAAKAEGHPLKCTMEKTDE